MGFIFNVYYVGISNMKRFMEYLLSSVTLSMEGREIEKVRKKGSNFSVYIVLTDTKTRFSKLSKLITGEPYNHVSISLDPDYSKLYTYALVSGDGRGVGGFKVETLSLLKGAEYLTYKLDLSKSAFMKVKSRLNYLAENIGVTTYNHLGLFNAIFNREVFRTNDSSSKFCSQFLVELLRESGIELFEGRNSSTVRPWEFVESRLLVKHSQGIF